MLAVPADRRETFHRYIQEGDHVIVYERHDRMKAVIVCAGATMQNRFGVFLHSDWIGKPFGCKVTGKTGGYVYLLAPTPELWTLVLSHRTQIIYIADISFVIGFLDIRPGCIVLESGTGSGSVTTSLARAVAPTGHVFTFDFHNQRATSARQDFERNGLIDLVTAVVRDIQDQGFPVELAGKADAVFLDLPQPWLAIPSVAEMLHHNGVLCSFSPCIEQVQHTCETLACYDFKDIRTFEVLLRTYGIHEEFFRELEMEDEADIPIICPPHKRLCPHTAPEHESEQCCKQSTGGIRDSKIRENESGGDNMSVTKNRSRQIMARPVSEARGHTGYLTFACTTKD
eukprot:c25541_g1_i1 orf=177-1202(+)